MPDSAQSLLSQSQWFLDVSPMIEALRLQPADFEYAHGRLHHVPSRHRFCFDGAGRVTIWAACGCSGRQIRHEQSQELFETFHAWRYKYWRPLQTNKEFASHFRKPSPWRRLVRDIKMAWRRFLGRLEPDALPTGETLATESRSAA